VQLGVDQQVLAHRQPVPQPWRFGQEADPAAQPCGGRPRHRLALHPDLAGRRLDEAGEHAQRGGLAGAVRAEQREDLARRQLERHVVCGHSRAEAAGQVGGGQHHASGVNS
jgi:hypothetical protein